MEKEEGEETEGEKSKGKRVGGSSWLAMASFYRQSLPAISAFIAYQTEGIRLCAPRLEGKTPSNRDGLMGRPALHVYVRVTKNKRERIFP